MSYPGDTISESVTGLTAEELDEAFEGALKKAHDQKVDFLSTQNYQLMLIDFEKKGVELDEIQKSIAHIAFSYGMLTGFDICQSTIRELKLKK